MPPKKKKLWLVNDPEARASRTKQVNTLTRATLLCAADVTEHLIAACQAMEDEAHQDAANHVYQARLLIGGMARNVDGAVEVVHEQLAAHDCIHKPKKRGKSK